MEYETELTRPAIEKLLSALHIALEASNTAPIKRALGGPADVRAFRDDTRLLIRMLNSSSIKLIVQQSHGDAS